MFNSEREIWIQVDGESMKSLIGRGAGGKAGWTSMTSKYNKKRQ